MQREDLDLPQTPQARERLNTQDGDDFPQALNKLSFDLKASTFLLHLKFFNFSSTLCIKFTSLVRHRHLSGRQLLIHVAWQRHGKLQSVCLHVVGNLGAKREERSHCLCHGTAEAILTCGFRLQGCIEIMLLFHVAFDFVKALLLKILLTFESNKRPNSEVFLMYFERFLSTFAKLASFQRIFPAIFSIFLSSLPGFW